MMYYFRGESDAYSGRAPRSDEASQGTLSIEIVKLAHFIHGYTLV